ncbi:hypothetical protein DACRYDRAFT_21741 [Dacryopinax primogenitus]|uniref:Uncharacterized protein n=1 Tax=Dacryopinax primogenitus (strain DJM 731) TaxID=1858805 RepID=M5GDX5_DACPD|nr:uncharacterized protein DACRYDRAFT_21741 [Dacryopinax primogenitus]EJU02778.1 hypothetical protein DACRYDRAFT_21741 [Dacryopinax primogenitus]
MAFQGKMWPPSTLLAAYEREATRLVKIGGNGRVDNLEVSIRLSLESTLMVDELYSIPLLAALCLLLNGARVENLAEMISSMEKNVIGTTLVLLQTGLAFEDRGDNSDSVANSRLYSLTAPP